MSRRAKGEDEHAIARSGGWSLGEQFKLPTKAALEKLDEEQLLERALAAIGHIHRRAVEAGIYLTQAKQLLAGESWEAWCLRRWPFDVRSANRCIRAAEPFFSGIMSGKTTGVAADTAVQALRAIGMEPAAKRPPKPAPPIIDATYTVTPAPHPDAETDEEAEARWAEEDAEREAEDALEDAQAAAAAEALPGAPVCANCARPGSQASPLFRLATSNPAAGARERPSAELLRGLRVGRVEAARVLQGEDRGQDFPGDPLEHRCPPGTQFPGESEAQRLERERAEADQDEDDQGDPAGPGPRVRALEQQVLARTEFAISEEERATALGILREHPLDETAAALLIYGCEVDEILPNPGPELGASVELVQDALVLLRATERAIDRLALPRLGILPSQRRALQVIRDALGTGLCPKCDTVIHGPIPLATQAIQDACGTQEERDARAAQKAKAADYQSRKEKAAAKKGGKK